MKSLFLSILFVGLSTVGLSTACLAQNFEVSASAGVSQQSNNLLGTLPLSTTVTQVENIKLTNGFRIGFRLTLNSWRFFGHEFGYAYNRSHLRFESLNPTEQGMGIHQGFYDFLAYATPEGSFFRPFATGGVQFANYVPPGSSAAQGGGQTKFGANYGGGVKFKILPNIGLRFDLRQYVNGKPFNLGGSGAIRQLEVSAGVGFLL